MKSLTKFYVAFSVILVNCLMLLVLLNVALLLRERWLSRRGLKPMTELTHFFNDDGSPVASLELSDPSFRRYDVSGVTGVSRRTTYETLIEMHRMTTAGLVYHPWIGYTEPVFSGRDVNVDPDPLGFVTRRTVDSDRGAGKPFSIFVFGGSTTFGFPVADAETWPSALAEILNTKRAVRVVNYAHCGHYSSQEVALALRLLKLGERPDVMIFMDGINEDSRNWGASGRDDIPEGSEMVAGAFEINQDMSFRGNLRRLGLVLESSPLLKMLPRSLKSGQATVPPEPTPDEDRRRGDLMYARYHANQIAMKAAAKAFGVRTLFFLQPDALVNYPVELYPRPVSKDFAGERRKHVEFFDRARSDGSTLILDHSFAQFGAHQRALVDEVHYTPAFNRFLAQTVSRYL